MTETAKPDAQQNPMACFALETGEELRVELFPEHAPQSVYNFIALAREGFFDGLPFWRIERDELIQSGAKNPDGTGFADYAIKGEFRSNGVDNPLRFTAGTLGYARLLPDSASSSFFILVEDSPRLDGEYAAFGRLIEGLELARRIAQAPCEPLSAELSFIHKAVNPVVIASVSIESFGVEYPAPTRLPMPSDQQLREEGERLLRERSTKPRESQA